MSRSEPEGLGGWLVLVALGLVVTPIRVLLLMVDVFLPMATKGYWNLLTDPASETYHQLWGPLIVFEAIGNVALIIASIAALFLFFQRAPHFPTFMIWYHLVALGFVATDCVLPYAIPAAAAQYDPSTTRGLVRSSVLALIWVPYMLRSRRVHNTFRTRATPSVEEANAPSAV